MLPLPELIATARREKPVDLLVRDVRLVNVLSGEIHPAHIAVRDGIVIGFEEYAAATVVDGGGRHCVPGLIDGHIHIESTLLAASAGLPLSVFVMMPSCVPATPMETAGAVLTAADVGDFLARYPDRILGLAEMMNYPGVLAADPAVLAKLAAAPWPAPSPTTRIT
ncbi:adenine deaminase [Desulfoprunum benzoelyticum]|uniref:Adenine deaminase n=1 Tax=Desulfoprunum benzoelyticum TaxID=1506996 RepID=A0A840V6R2_9BACT|nr:hypothetical protein [Desulfoprunum benzoelyticum]MBB5349610.1 adenine deaminase [Desulfoprunum benzoelyticum]